MKRARLFPLFSVLASVLMFSSTAIVASELIQYNGYGWTVAGNGAFTAGNGYAYAGCAGALMIFEVNSGAEVKRIYLPGKIEDAELVGSTLYLAAANQGLLIYDVSVPSSPVLLDSWQPAEEMNVRSVAVSGGYAYLRVGSTIRTIRLIDLVQTGSISLTGTGHDLYGQVEATTNAVVYECFDSTNPTDIWLGVLDRRASPENPVFAAVFDGPGRLNSTYATADSELVYCALGNGFKGLETVDVTDPTAPFSVGSASNVSYNGRGVFVSAGYAYLTTQGSTTTGELAIYDVSSGVPLYLGKYVSPMGLQSVAVTSDRAVCSGANNQPSDEVQCVDVTNKGNPLASWSVDVPAFIEGVYVKDQYMYLAAGHDGLWIADVSDPNNVVTVSTLDPMVNMNLAENIWISSDGNYAYTAEGNYTVFYDVTNKSGPAVITYVDYGGWQEGVHVSRGYLFVCSHGTAGRGGGVTVVSLANPYSPQEVAWYSDTVAKPLDCWVDSNGYIYVAAGRYMKILRFIAPSTIQFVSEVLMPGDGEMWDIQKYNNYVFGAIKVSGTSTAFRGMRVYDVTDPANPVLASTYETLGGFEGIWVSNNVAYLTTQAANPYERAGITALDVTNPSAPLFVDQISEGGSCLNVQVLGSRAYVAGYSCGAPILELVQGDPNAPVANFSGAPRSGVYPLTVSFTDLSSNNPTSWAWDFDNDGTVDSNQQNPSWEYAAKGKYTVKLTATNAYGADVEYKVNYIEAIDPYQQTWKASTDFSSTQGQNQWWYKEWTGSVYNNMTWDAGNNRWKGTYTYCLIGINWQHPDTYDPARTWVSPYTGSAHITGNVRKGDTGGGDGVIATILRNSTVIWGPQFIAYNDNVGYNIDVTTNVMQGDAIYFRVNQNGNGAFDTTTWDPSITLTWGGNPPVANFSGAPTSGTAPLTVSFTDLSTDGPTAWAWDFDNNGTTDSTQQNPSYQYQSPGSYTVRLTASNAYGSDDEVKVDYITVTVPPPVANFSGSPTSGLAPLTVNFTDLSTNNPTAWGWDFDNNGTTDSTVQNPSYQYTAAGRYSVKLTATNAAGSDDEVKVNYITVSQKVTFTSIGADDGWVLESGENTNVGGSRNSTGTRGNALRAGDDGADRQYRCVVSFNTSSIPDSASIGAATLKLVRGSLTGTNPFTTHGTCYADIRMGTFGAQALENSDFQASATAVQVATMSEPGANGGTSYGSLNSSGLAAINKVGVTQLRVYFSLDDNDDMGNDYVGFYSGENSTPSNRPVLELTYTP